MATWRQLKKNPRLWKTFQQRDWLLRRIRQFFQKEGFLEIQTPTLVPALIPESYLRVFQTTLHDKLDHSWTAYLTPSPELWHKKLLAAGAPDIFEITRSYRNGDMGGHFHNPEFTLIEWYRHHGDYWQTMDDSENLLRFIWPSQKVTYQGKTLSLADFERITVAGAFEKHLHIDDRLLFDKDKLFSWARQHGYRLPAKISWEELYNLIYLQDIEPHLGREKPTIIYDFPSQFAPLAKKNPKDPRFRQRFELYLFGVELADAYNELTDPQDQRQEFEKEEKGQKQRHKIDWDFIAALKSGLPACSGVALGIDRLLMILANKTNIQDVILFAAEEIFPTAP